MDDHSVKHRVLQALDDNEWHSFHNLLEATGSETPQLRRVLDTLIKAQKIEAVDNDEYRITSSGYFDIQPP